MKFFNNLRKTLLTLRFSILSIFITLFIIAILSLITFNYIRYSKTMLYLATQLMQKASNELFNNIKKELLRVELDTENAAQLIKHEILNRNDVTEMMNYIGDLNKKLTIVQQAYWCTEEGDCINTLIEPNDSITTDLIFNSKKPPYREYIYRDVQGNILDKKKIYTFDYDPRKRPFYIEAKNVKKTYWTDIYPLKEQAYLAVTVAAPVYHAEKFLGIFAMDIRLDWLSYYIQQLKVSKNALIFIVDHVGNLVAFPEVYQKEKNILQLVNIHDVKNTPWIAVSFDIYKKTRQPFFSFTYEGKKYLANYVNTNEHPLEDWNVGIVAPEDDFIGELKKASLMDTQIGLAILVLGIILVSGFVTRVVNPIKNLVKETEKIKNFDLEHEIRVQSRIKEIMLLANAIHALVSSLKSFQKYVPATLVRQLIDAGEDVHMGGTKKKLAIFFSDIKDFTTLSENMDPSELLELMCEYFEELSKIIVAEKGTIDKYIGDSIMAFWGAPLPVENPCHAAARAALNSIHCLEKLNKAWQQKGKSPLITRIGIHYGDVIVGNVGSSERINYTALGDAINVASRLEGLNKTYGTSIIVSEAIYQEIKDQFILRKIDYVTIKGKTESGNIYELIAEKKGSGVK